MENNLLALRKRKDLKINNKNVRNPAKSQYKVKFNTWHKNIIPTWSWVYEYEIKEVSFKDLNLKLFSNCKITKKPLKIYLIDLVLEKKKITSNRFGSLLFW